MPKKIILMLGDKITERNADFGIYTVEQAGYEYELVWINDNFSSDLTADLRRIANSLHVSDVQLDTDFMLTNQRAFERETADGWNRYEQDFGDFCWQYVLEALRRGHIEPNDIACVVGTNERAVHYMTDHLQILSRNVMPIVVTSTRQLSA